MRKATFLSALFILLLIDVNAQVVAVQIDKENRAMLCLDNPLTIAAAGIPSNEIVVTTDNGTVTEVTDRGAGHYNYRANRTGHAMIYVARRNRRGTAIVLDSTQLRVHSLPLRATFAGKSHGSLKHVMLLVQLGIVVSVTKMEIDARYKVNSHTVLVHRDGNEIYRHKVEGPLIDQATSDFFHTLKNNDVVRFDDIQVKECNGEARSAEAIEISVVEAQPFRKEKNDDPVIFVEDPVTGEEVEKNVDSVWIKAVKTK